MQNTVMLLKGLKDEAKTSQSLMEAAMSEVRSGNNRMLSYLEAYADRRDSAMLKISLILRHEEKHEPYNRTSRAYEIWCKEESIIKKMTVR